MALGQAGALKLVIFVVVIRLGRLRLMLDRLRLGFLLRLRDGHLLVRPNGLLPLIATLWVDVLVDFIVEPVATVQMLITVRLATTSQVEDTVNLIGEVLGGRRTGCVVGLRRSFLSRAIFATSWFGRGLLHGRTSIFNLIVYNSRLFVLSMLSVLVASQFKLVKDSLLADHLFILPHANQLLDKRL